MLIVIVFCEPRNDVTVRPVNLQCARVLVVNVILSAPGTISDEHRRKKEPYINGHLIHMYTLFDAELWDKYVEGRVRNSDDLRLTNDGSITGSQV